MSPFGPTDGWFNPHLLSNGFAEVLLLPTEITMFLYIYICISVYDTIYIYIIRISSLWLSSFSHLSCRSFLFVSTGALLFSLRCAAAPCRKLLEQDYGFNCSCPRCAGAATAATAASADMVEDPGDHRV